MEGNKREGDFIVQPLFSSTTGNSNYSLFVGPREAHLWNHYNTELLEIVAKQNFNYWPIETSMSDTDDIYGEAEKKIPRQPINVFGWILLDQPETQSGQFSTEVKRKLEIYLHVDRLTEVGVRARVGDFVEWDNQFFEITSAVVPSFAHGLPEIKVGVNLEAISTRENVFNPRDDNGYEDSRDNDTSNPY